MGFKKSLPCSEDGQQYGFGDQRIAVSQVEFEAVPEVDWWQSLVGKQYRHQAAWFLKIQPSSQVESAHSQAQTVTFQLF